MSDNSLIILGTSSGIPQADRATSGYLLKTGDSCTLIDCGGGVISSLLKSGTNPLSVDRVFISHTHSDHVCELSLFVQLVYVTGRDEPIELYLPSEFVEPFKNYLTAVYMIPERLPFELKIIGYDHGFEYESSFKLKAFKTTHLSKYENEIQSLGLPNKMQCHCFVIELSGKRIFYSADIGSLDDILDHLDGCTYAIIESTHIDLEEFLQMAPTKEVAKYILTHLGNPKEVEGIRASIDKSGLKNIILAEERMKLPI